MAAGGMHYFAASQSQIPEEYRRQLQEQHSGLPDKRLARAWGTKVHLLPEQWMWNHFVVTCESQFFGEWRRSLKEEFGTAWQQVSAILKRSTAWKIPEMKKCPIRRCNEVQPDLQNMTFCRCKSATFSQVHAAWPCMRQIFRNYCRPLRALCLCVCV